MTDSPDTPRRRPSGQAPGRRRTGSTSRSGSDAARPIGSDSPPRRSAVGEGGQPSARRPPTYAPQRSGGNRPRSIPPGGGNGEPAGNPATKVMPARAPQGGSRGSESSRAAGRRPGEAPPERSGGSRRRARRRRLLAVFVLLLVLVLAWPVGLLIWANGKIQHIEAGEPSISTSGTTYLLTGSDSRGDGYFEGDPTEGERADTIMILTVPPSGTPSLISLPRDTYVEIPGRGWHKLNTAFAWGGPELLRATVESLTQIEVDHYVEIGMGGLAGIVDAVGGVELCLDYDVSDAESQLEWQAGCHVADGETALAFARMRMSDPMGDIGRTQRQQQVIQAIASNVADPALAVKPWEQVRLVDAGLGALYVSEGSGIVDLGRMALAFRNATGPDGVRGTPPIESMNYQPGGVGSTVLLADSYPAFFASVADGTVTQDDVGG